jgi:hypothetical protein
MSTYTFSLDINKFNEFWDGKGVNRQQALEFLPTIMSVSITTESELSARKAVGKISPKLLCEDWCTFVVA